MALRSPQQATTDCTQENKDVRSLQEAKVITSSRAKFLYGIQDADLATQVVTQNARDTVWQILTSFDDWKKWRFEIGRVLRDEKYPETAVIIAGRCLQNITNEPGEAIFKFTRNLLSSLAQFSSDNSEFYKSAVRTGILSDILDFLSRPELLNNQDGKKVNLIKICLRLPLILWYNVPLAWQTVYQKYVIPDGIQVFPNCLEMKDNECRWLAYVWLLRLTEKYKTVGKSCGGVRNIISSLGQALKTSIEKEDTEMVPCLINALLVVAKLPPETFIQGDGNASDIIRQDTCNEGGTCASCVVRKALSQLIECSSPFYNLCTLQNARRFLIDISPPEQQEKWTSMHFQPNNELKTVEAVRGENIVRIAFLNKLYDLSPDSLVCIDAAHAISLLQQSRGIYKAQSEGWKTAYANVILQENFIELALKYDKVLIKRDLAKEQLTFEMVSMVHNILWNLSDCCEERIAKAGFVNFLLGLLQDVDNIVNKCACSQNYDYVLVSSAISITYNTSRSSQVKHKFLDLNAANVLVPYIAEQFGKTVQASLCIAYVVSDTPEASRLADEQGIIKTVVSLANLAMRRTDRKAVLPGGATWSLAELLDGLGVLATNDSNKSKLMDNGVLGLVNQLILSSDNAEKIRGIDLVWALCFDTKVKNEIVAKHNEDVIKPMKDLAQSLNSDVSQDVQNAAKKVVMFIEKWGAIDHETKTMPQAAEQTRADGHIFLSYSWKQQETVLQIRQELLNQNYKVWMDVDKMHGGLLDAMAKAVEDASVVVICFSQSYKESNPCRAEARYAHSLGKTVVPVNMEYHYRPDGWLGIIVLPEKYVDMSLKKRPFETAMGQLLSEIEISLGAVGPSTSASQSQTGSTNNSRGKVETDEPARTHGEVVSASFFTKIPPTKTLKCAKWSCDDVAQWLKEENIQLFETKMQRFDGKKLSTLLQIRSQAPEFFYQILKEHFCHDFCASLPDLLDLIAALDKLASNDA